MTSLEQAFGISQSLRGAAPQGEGSAAPANAGDGFAQTIKRIEDDARDASGGAREPPPEAPEPRPSSAAGVSVALSPCLFPYAVSPVAPERAPSPAAQQELHPIDRSLQPASVSPDAAATATQGAAPSARDDLLSRRPDHAQQGAKSVFAVGSIAANGSLLAPASETGERKLAAHGAAAVESVTDIQVEMRKEPKSSLALAAPQFSPELPGEAPKIHIGELAVHLPIALDRALTEMIPPTSEGGPALVRHVGLPAPSRHEAMKILKFDVEPGAMGPISVRMTITQSRIEIRMDAQSAAAPALMEARDALATAIGDKGLTLDAYEVRVLSAAPQSVIAPDAPAENGGHFERGSSNDDGSSQQGRRHGGKQATPPRDEPPSSFVPVGLVL